MKVFVPPVRIGVGFNGPIGRAVFIDGKTEFQLWNGSAWEPGADGGDVLMGKPISREELAKLGIPES